MRKTFAGLVTLGYKQYEFSKTPFPQRVRSLRLHSVDREEEGVEDDRWATCDDSSMMMGTCRTTIPLLLRAAVA